MRLASPAQTASSTAHASANSEGDSPARWRALIDGPERKLLWGIIVLALLLRLDSLDLIRFDGSVVQTLAQSQQMLRGETLPLIGTATGLGLHNPPWLTYLMTIPVLVSADPLAAAAFIVLLATLSVLLAFVVARRYFGARVAVAAAALWAASPSGVGYAREIAPTALVAALVVPCVYGMLLAVIDERPWGWTLAVGTLGLMIGLSLRAVSLVPVISLATILYCRRIGWLHVLLGCCIAILVLGPYLYFENLSRFGDLRAAWQTIRSQSISWDRLAGTLPVVRNVSGGDVSAIAGAIPGSQAQAAASTALHILDGISGWLALASIPLWWALAIRAWSHWKERRHPAQYVLLGLCTGVPLAVGALVPGVASARLAAILQVPILIGVGAVMDSVALSSARPGWPRLVSNVAKVLVGILLAGLIGWQALSVVTLRERTAHSDDTGLGVSLRFWNQTADLVRREALEAGTDQIWVLDANALSLADCKAILDYLLQAGPQPVYLGSQALLLPAGRPALYLSLGNPASQVRKARQDVGQEIGLVVSPGGHHTAAVYRRDAEEIATVLAGITHEAVIALPDGLRLLGYDLPDQVRPGTILRMAAYWTWVSAAPPPSDVDHRISMAIQTPDGESIAEAQGLGLDERWWREGYLLRQDYTFALSADMPSGEYAIVASMTRDAPEGERPSSASAEPSMLTSARIGSLLVEP